MAQQQRWLLLALFLRGGFGSFPSNPSSTCQSALDASCVQLCWDDLSESRGCDGPMVARSSGPGEDEWRCYSPSTLDADQEEYVSGDCYCSRDAELSLIEDLCEQNVTTVFSVDYDGDNCYRIPSIIRLASGRMLAFAEQRTSGCSDNGSNNLVLRRSNDDGATWGDIITIEAGEGRSLSNPNPVEVTFPNGTRAVLFHYDTMNNPSEDSHGQNLQRWSLDEGATWGAPSDLTEFMPPGFEGCLPGPSVGIQQQPPSSRSAGAAAAETIYFSCHASNGALLYFSSNMGQSWNYSEPITGLNECSIALLPNRSVAMNCRGGSIRKQLTFSEGGQLLSGPILPPGLVDPGCQGSIVAAPPAQSSQQGTLFLSNDATSDTRYNMTVKRSDDAGATWDEGLLIWDRKSAYSQLVAWTEEGAAHMALLFELGTDSKYEAIGFVRVPLDC